MATGSVTPFHPTGTVSLSAGITSASVQLAGGGDSVVVTNTTSSLAYVRFGADPSVTANSDRHAGSTECPCHARGEQLNYVRCRRIGYRQWHDSFDPR